MRNINNVPLAVALLFLTVGGWMIFTSPQASQQTHRLPVLREIAQWWSEPELILPSGVGVGWYSHKDKGLLATVGLTPGKARRISFCEQRANGEGSALVPLALGFDWPTVRSYALGNLTAFGPEAMHTNLKNPMIDGGNGENVPAMMIDARPVDGHYPRLRLKSQATGGVYAIITDEQAQVVMRDEGDRTGEAWFFRHRAWVTWRAEGDQPMPGKPWQPLGNRMLSLERVEYRGCPVGGLAVRVWQPSKGALYRFAPVGAAISDELLEQSKRWRLAPGEYALQAARLRREDADLFAKLQSADLLQVNAQGALTMPPIDTAVAPALKPLLSTYYNRLPGRYVRKAVARFNDERLVLATRILSGAHGRTGFWRSSGEVMAQTDQMPLSAWALLPAGSEQHGWQRASRWLATDSAETDYWFRAEQLRKGDALELLIIGEVQGVVGANVVQRQARCLRPPCNTSVQAEHLRLAVLSDGEVSIKLRPHERSELKKLFAEEFRHVHLAGQQAHWRNAPQGDKPSRSTPTVKARDGRLLFNQSAPTELARELGLAALVGLNTQQTGSLAHSVSRLPGEQAHQATLSVDSHLQQHAQAALQFHAQALAPKHSKRRAGLVVMDAENGDIVAAAGYPVVAPDGIEDDRLLAMEVVNAGNNALRIPAWQHDGSAHHAPGSTFKLVTALSLEEQARGDDSLNALLAGLPVAQLRQVGDSRGYYFNPDAACYPADRSSCRWRVIKTDSKTLQSGPAIANFGVPGKFVDTPFDKTRRYKDQVYGLEHALRDSMNTWFAWLAERRDQTLFGRGDTPGIGHAMPLVPGALSTERPLLAMAERLGFGDTIELDGGLLPDQWRYTFWDALRSSASNIDPARDRHGVRQQSLGLRMQAVPLQMARVSAAIATGYIVQPRLLLQLDRQRSKAHRSVLGIDTQRIKKGMARVAQDGTAKSAFSDKKFDDLRLKLHLKTGTATIAGSDKKLNNASITGFLLPGGLPGESRTLAFACVISYVEATGGGSCGRVIASFFESLLIQQLREQAAGADNETNFSEQLVF